MSTDTLCAAITAALRRRDPNADLDVTPSVTLLGSRTSTAAVVLYGADGAVIDVVARANSDARALRGVAFAVGLREDGSDPEDEIARLEFALQCEAQRHEETRAAVREYLAALDALDSARRSYLSATIGSESVTTGENVRRHDAMVAAEARVREAEHRFRAIVEGDG
jgi:hypothetical protein